MADLGVNIRQSGTITALQSPESPPPRVQQDGDAEPKVPLHMASSANLADAGPPLLDGGLVEPTVQLRRLSDGSPPMLDRVSVQTIAGETEEGQVAHKVLGTAAAVMQIPKRLGEASSQAAKMNTAAVAAGGVLDLLALPVKLRKMQQATKTSAEAAGDKARYRQQAQQWKAQSGELRGEIRELRKEIRTKERALARGDGPPDPEAVREVKGLKKQLRGLERARVGLAEARHQYQTASRKASRSGWDAFKQFVGSWQAASGVARSGLLLGGQAVAAGGGFIAAGALGTVAGAITVGVGVKDTHDHRIGLQRANDARGTATTLKASPGAGKAARDAADDLAAIADGARSKRKGGIFNSLSKVFMGSTAIAGGAVSIGLGLALIGTAVLSVATLGIAAGVIGGVAIGAAVGLAVYKHAATKKLAGQAQAASASIQRLQGKIDRETNRPDGARPDRLQRLEVSLRDAQTTLYRTDPNAAVKRLSELLRSPDPQISAAAGDVAQKLVGGNAQQQNLLGDLMRASGGHATDDGGKLTPAFEMIKTRAYG